jgi:hypothetical protein
MVEENQNKSKRRVTSEGERGGGKHKKKKKKKKKKIEASLVILHYLGNEGSPDSIFSITSGIHTSLEN